MARAPTPEELEQMRQWIAANATGKPQAPQRPVARVDPESARTVSTVAGGNLPAPVPARSTPALPGASRAGPSVEDLEARALADMATAAPARAPAVMAEGAPAGRPPPPDEMESAQQRAAMNRLVAGLGRAGSVIGGAIGGQRPDTGFWDARASAANAPVDEVAGRRKAMSDALRAKFDQDFKLRQLGGQEKQNELTIGLRRDQQAATAKQNEISNELRRLGLKYGADNAAASREFREWMARNSVEDKRNQRTDKQVQDLGEAVTKSGAPGFYQQHSEASRIINENADDLPGFGRLAGRLPDFAVPREGVGLRQAVGQMLAEYRKGVTGAGMSDSERTEYGAITGLIQSGDEVAVKQGVERLKRAVDARTRSQAASFPTAAVERYAERTPIPKEALGVGGQVRMRGPSGEVGMVDASELADAEANGWERL